LFPITTKQLEVPVDICKVYIPGQRIMTLQNLKMKMDIRLAALSSDPYGKQTIHYTMHLRTAALTELKDIFSVAASTLIHFKWLSVNGRFGYDHYDATGYTFYSPLSSLTSRTPVTGLGALDNYWRSIMVIIIPLLLP
jgi:hypothetical protein